MEEGAYLVDACRRIKLISILFHETGRNVELGGTVLVLLWPLAYVRDHHMFVAGNPKLIISMEGKDNMHMGAVKTLKAFLSLIVFLGELVQWLYSSGCSVVGVLCSKKRKLGHS